MGNSGRRTDEVSAYDLGTEYLVEKEDEFSSQKCGGDLPEVELAILGRVV